MTDQGNIERLRKLWERYAPRYDCDIQLVERLLFSGGREWVGSQATGDVLEVAIGTGLNLSFFSSEVRLTGIDLSPAMLRTAGTRATELSRSVELHEGNAEAMPFLDASFDTVVCTLGLCGIPDEKATIAEMYRVLRPGGTLLLLDHIGSHHGVIHFGQWLMERLTVRLLGDCLTRRPLPLVHQAGFIIRSQERTKAGIVERLAATKPTDGDCEGT